MKERLSRKPPYLNLAVIERVDSHLISVAVPEGDVVEGDADVVDRDAGQIGLKRVAGGNPDRSGDGGPDARYFRFAAVEHVVTVVGIGRSGEAFDPDVETGIGEGELAGRPVEPELFSFSLHHYRVGHRAVEPVDLEIGAASGPSGESVRLDRIILAGGEEKREKQKKAERTVHDVY